MKTKWFYMISAASVIGGALSNNPNSPEFNIVIWIGFISFLIGLGIDIQGWYNKKQNEKNNKKERSK